jgi:hypothetical protein
MMAPIVWLGAAPFLVRWMVTRLVAGGVLGVLLLICSWLAPALAIGGYPATYVLAAVLGAMLPLADWLMLRRPFSVHWAYVPSYWVVSPAGGIAISGLTAAYPTFPLAGMIHATGGYAAYLAVFHLMWGAALGVLQGIWQWVFLRRLHSRRRWVKAWLLVPASAVCAAIVQLALTQVAPMPSSQPAHDASSVPGARGVAEIAAMALSVGLPWAIWGLPAGVFLTLVERRTRLSPPVRPT